MIDDNMMDSKELLCAVVLLCCLCCVAKLQLGLLLIWRELWEFNQDKRQNYD